MQRSVELSEELRFTREQLEIKIDDNEQYTRKDSLRIEGIDITDGETHQALGTKIVQSLNKLGAKVSLTDFHRYHRSGGRRTLADGRVVAQSIVRFNNWPARTRALKASLDGKREERVLRQQFVRVDITKRRLALLKDAQNALRNHPVAHAFANSECILKVKNRSDAREYAFNSHAELSGILDLLCMHPSGENMQPSGDVMQPSEDNVQPSGV